MKRVPTLAQIVPKRSYQVDTTMSEEQMKQNLAISLPQN